MIIYATGVVFNLIGAYYLFQDFSCDRPQPSVGVASGCFFIAAVLCFK